MKLSVVATLYQSSAHIIEFYQRVSDAAERLVGGEYEIILVNDGSPDDSFELAVQITENDDHVVVVDLSRNFGHHKAMMTGLSYAKGEHVFLIDSDLEEDPEWLIIFAEQMTNDSCDVVYGMQNARRGGHFEIWSGKVFYLLFNALTGMRLNEGAVTARLMTRRYVNALLLHDEREVFMSGLWQITGFEQRSRSIKKLSTSKTTYTLRKKMILLVDAITSFSNAPLVYIFYVGVFLSLCAFSYIAYLIFLKVFFSQTIAGWTSLMASIWLLGGMMISFIGLVGIYLSKVFSEVKRRPLSIVKEVYQKRKHKTSNDVA